MAASVVKCDNLQKTYGEGETAVMALRGINLDVTAGELFMLIGPSGCGKTTLISVIAGILDVTNGGCAVLGQDLAKLKTSEKISFRAVNIGFVFQAYNLLPALTSAENVAVPLLINGVPRTEAVRRARALLGRVGMGDRAEFMPSQLSGGQMQRVAIARAMVHSPRIIVCDEPTSALDAETGQMVISLMRDLAKESGQTLIIVTHDNRIYHYADRIGTMNDGRITRIEDGPKEKIA